MQYVSDRLFTKVSGPVGDAALSALTLSPTTILGAVTAPNVMATDAEGRELVHMDRTARDAGRRGAAFGAGLGALGSGVRAGLGGAKAPVVIGAAGLGAALGGGLGALFTPATSRTKTRLLQDNYYRDPGKPMGQGGIALGSSM